MMLGYQNKNSRYLIESASHVTTDPLIGNKPDQFSEGVSQDQQVSNV